MSSPAVQRQADSPAEVGRAVDERSPEVPGTLNPLWARIARVGVLAFADFVTLAACGALAYLIWARPVRQQPADMYAGLLPFLGLFLLGYLQADLYPGFGLGPVETLRRLTLVTAFGYVVLASASFAFKLPHLFSRMTVGIAFVLSVVMLPLVRNGMLAVVRRLSWWREPVVLIGSRPLVARTIRRLEDSPGSDYRPRAVIRPDGPQADAGRDTVEGVEVAGGFEAAAQVAQRGVKVAVLAFEHPPGESTLDLLQRHFYRVLTLRDFEHLPVEGAQLRNLGGVLTIEYTSNLLLPHNRGMKRLMDLLVAGVGLLLASPLILLSLVAVRLVSRGNPVFVQERSGMGGETVRVLKVRSMYVDAEDRLNESLQRDPALRDEWDSRFKLRRDPRLVPVFGRLLRRFSLDELPQLWNVLKGEMSLVGPRPFPEYHMRGFPPEFRALRRRMRPGITGLWQVMVRGEGDVEDQQFFDTYYLRNWSVWLDLYILGRTVGAVLRGRGAY